MRHPLAILVLVPSALALLATVALRPAAAGAAPAMLAPLQSGTVSGLSVEAKDDPFGKGFDFRFRSDSNSTTTMSLDPLGHTQSASGSISSKSGSITLNGRYDRSKREIEITARRGGQEIGEYRWRVEAVLR
ncbi:MAG: hypothetical protein RI967_309 [Planctomycetota bacterium]